MSTNGHHPETNGRDPLRADEWLEARHAANREQTSPFARGRDTNGTPPPPPPVVEDHDPTSLPRLFPDLLTNRIRASLKVTAGLRYTDEERDNCATVRTHGSRG